MGKSWFRAVGVLAGSAVALATPAAAQAAVTYSVGPISNLTNASCSGRNAEVEPAVDPSNGYIYEDWMGCSKIAFSRSTDGGRTFSAAFTVPGSIGSNLNSWDPAGAGAPDGSVVYAGFMVDHGSQWDPRLAASYDPGATVGQGSGLVPPDAQKWGDRDFIAVGPDGSVYVTWDYGPQRSSVTSLCSASGSCGFATGDLNVVMQKSTDHGRTWGKMTYISPGFPASGGDSAPMVIEPSGKIDVLYQGYHITDTTTYAMEPAFSYYTSSTDQGKTWSTPIAVGPEGGTTSLDEWWIDGGIGRGAGGQPYAVWDTQGSTNDIGWLSFSTDGGLTWSPAIQVPPDQLVGPHLMEVAGGGSGIAYISWLSYAHAPAHALYVGTFSLTRR